VLVLVPLVGTQASLRRVRRPAQGPELLVQPGSHNLIGVGCPERRAPSGEDRSGGLESIRRWPDLATATTSLAEPNTQVLRPPRATTRSLGGCDRG
jgi:hypothetical protein